MTFREHLDYKQANGILTFVVTDQKEQEMLNRLRSRYEEFEHLANVGSWQDIRHNREVCKSLQQAWDILYNAYYYRPKYHRCMPCEMEALCAIKQIKEDK